MNAEVTVGEALRVLMGSGVASKPDVAFGESLAGYGEDDWSASARWSVYVMLRKYRGALAERGVDYDSLPAPERPLVDDAGSRLRARAESFARARSQSAVAGRVVTWDFRLRCFVVRYPLDDAIRERVRALESRRYDGERRAWLVDASCAADLARIVEDFGFEVEDGPALDRMVDGAEVARTHAARPRRAWSDGDRWRVATPQKDAALVGLARAVRGAAFDADRGEWEFPSGSEFEVLRMVDECDLWVSDDDRAWLEDGARSALDALDASAAMSVEGGLDLGGFVGELWPFQAAGVEYVLRHAEGRSFIGDEVGLGKTPQALASAEASGAFPLLVVCRKAKVMDWVRECDRFLPGRSIAVLDTGADDRPAWFSRHPEHRAGREAVRQVKVNAIADVMVVNLDILATVKGRKRKGWGERLEGRLRGLVVDESQEFKEARSQRTKAAVALSKTLAPTRGPVVLPRGLALCLTGTAVMNRPVELVAQLDIIGRLAEFGGRATFERRYCDAKPKTIRVRGGNEKRIWVADGATNLPELHERLRRSGYVRRQKADVLPDLPPVVRQTEEMPLTNAAEYARAQADVANYVAEVAARRAAEEGVSEFEVLKRGQAAMSAAERAEGIRRIGVMRMLCGLGKVEAVSEWVDAFLADSEEKLILFAWHQDVQAAYARRFPGAAVVRAGEKDANDRAVRRFQSDPACRLIVLSITVGSAGLTLTEAGYVAWAELPWRPSDIDQGEGRAYGRLNDAHGITSYFLLGTMPGQGDERLTYDWDLALLLDNKRSITDAVNAGKEGATGESIMGALMERLASR